MTLTLRNVAMLAFASASIGWWNESPMAQSLTPSRSRVVIPFLANASKPDDLDFEGAECDVDGDRMTCAFQQVFLTTSPVAPDTCLVTTNRYEREFRRDSPSHWTSTKGPEGACGVLDVATLQDAGGVRWTMELKKVVTNTDAGAACQSVNVKPEIFSWQNIRRPLPCKNVQPGGLTP